MHDRSNKDVSVIHKLPYKQSLSLTKYKHGFFYIKNFKSYLPARKKIHRNYKTEEILHICTSTILNEQQTQICVKCSTYCTVSGFWKVLITWTPFNIISLVTVKVQL